MDSTFNILDDSHISRIQSNDKKNPIAVINNDKKEKKIKSKSLKELKKSIPKKLRKSKYEPTEEQKLRIFKNYIQPKLTDNNTNDPNNDLVQSLKDAFGQDNKEKLNEVLPTFDYRNDLVDNNILNNEKNEQERLLKEKINDDVALKSFKEKQKRQERKDLKLLRSEEKKKRYSLAITPPRFLTKDPYSDTYKQFLTPTRLKDLKSSISDSAVSSSDSTFPSDNVKSVSKLQAVIKRQQAQEKNKIPFQEHIDTQRGIDLAIKNMLEKERAGTKIQNLFRNKQARKELEKRFLQKEAEQKEKLDPKIETGLYRIINDNSATKIQKIFRGKKARDEAFIRKINKTENDLNQTEKLVYGLKKDINDKMGDTLRKEKAKIKSKIQNIKGSSKSLNEKFNLLKPVNKKLDQLNHSIINKKRGRKAKA